MVKQPNSERMILFNSQTELGYVFITAENFRSRIQQEGNSDKQKIDGRMSVRSCERRIDKFSILLRWMGFLRHSISPFITVPCYHV